MSIKPIYRPDIDGLRAIAVLAVVLYHYGATWLPGGFTGVDVFFVISGFLITGILSEQISDHRFSYLDFFLRRVRRLLPAALVMILASFMAAILIFTPSDLIEFSRSAKAAVLGYSNITFWRDSGYFAAASETKPLLHTWSLSVEWQFYLLWPGFLWVVHRLLGAKWLLPAILTACFVSLVANWSFLDGQVFFLGPLATYFADGPSSIFYLVPFRVFEFAIGAAVLWLPQLRGRLADFVFTVGLAMIALAAITYTAGMVYPGNAALLPCLGTAAVLYSGSVSRLARLLRSRPAVHIGHLSYSLYLVHWPLLVFFEYYQMRPATPVEIVALLALAFVLAEVLYAVVEKPVHFGGRSSTNFRQAVTSLSIFLAAGILVFAGQHIKDAGGLPERIDPASLLLAQPETALTDITGRRGCLITCTFGNPNGPTILLVGDSHSDHYTKALEAMGGAEFNFVQVYSPSCFFGAHLVAVPAEPFGEQCRQSRAELDRLIKTTEFDAIIVSERWPGYGSILQRDGKKLEIYGLENLFPVMLEDVAELWAGFTGPTIIVSHAPDTNRSCYGRPSFVPMVCPPVSTTANKVLAASFQNTLSASALDVHFVNTLPILCSADYKCPIINADGNLLYTDDHHLSIYGASMVVPSILNPIRERLAERLRLPS